MSSLFDVLPGLEMPVAKVTQALRDMWDVEPGPGQATAPSDFRAVQMNVILHFGLSTPADEALHLFDTAVLFAQKYPCRIVVLCPVEHHDAAELLRGKLFAQCYLGPGLRRNCCCEALLLSYPTSESGFLENQVSIWLEGDLPTYHWFHRVPAERIRQHYLGFTRNCRRIVWDSSLEHDDLSALPWPRLGAVNDLAWARLLPLRQSVGQFLAATPPAQLIAGLDKVEVRAAPGFRGEGRHFARWLIQGLRECRRAAGLLPEPTPALDFAQDDALATAVQVRWSYADPARHLRVTLPCCEGLARVEAAFPGAPLDLDGTSDVVLRVGCLAPEAALAEALFF